jgi:hypothetical protein
MRFVLSTLIVGGDRGGRKLHDESHLRMQQSPIVGLSNSPSYCWRIYRIHGTVFHFTTLCDLRFSRRWLWRMTSAGMLRCVALVRIDVLEELSASFISVTRIGELGKALAVTSNRCTLWRNTKVFLHSVHRLLVSASVVHWFLSPWWRRW